MKYKQYKFQAGLRYPPGARKDHGGVNFSIFSRHATVVELLLYARPDSPVPFQIIPLDPDIHRTFFFWHVYVEGLPVGTCYTWRVDGPNEIRDTGFRFDKNRVLLDPWARAVTDELWDRRLAHEPDEVGTTAHRAMVIEDDYDWEGDRPINHPLENSIIYELHVGGFTRAPSSKVVNPGTFAGIIEKIPYLKKLGITDVELLPIMAFDAQDVPPSVAALGLQNYWGYSPHSFFSPHPHYCNSSEAGTHLREFRDLVKALHRAGIGVILDVVFNHTAEGDALGPSINFKGFGNEMFYHLDPNDRSVYRDYTGCGNTVNCNHPLVAQFLIDCLEYWVKEMHVDGFRFDLASVLARGEDGEPMYHAPVLWSIEFSDVLAHTKLIAEAWDAGGLYQVGDFPGFRWAEWNGRYRDVMRRFVRGDMGLVGEVATRMSGSADLYESDGRLPINSINFITCHDGFTLYDLTSYNQKHNEANGEDNRDGANDNYSWNCGHEGETDSRAINELRRRQAKNYIAILLLSQGVPMLLSGDEVLRTQQGNNNVWCQDNELGWLDWKLMVENQSMLRFVRHMIAFRKRHPCLMRTRFLNAKQLEGVALPDVCWHGTETNKPLWNDPDARLLSFTLRAVGDAEEHLQIMLNMSGDPVTMQLLEIGDRSWFRAVDTWLASPQDVLEPQEQPIVDGGVYCVQQRSVVVLESRAQ